MRRIKREDIQRGIELLTVQMPYAMFAQRFGEHHLAHPSDWDAPGPVELWFFELPWGHKVALEYHLAINQFNIYMQAMEIEAVIDHLDLRPFRCHLHGDTIELLKTRHPGYLEDITPASLYRQDDNGNVVLIKTYESRRVADYYRKLFEDRGHKQLYWIEDNKEESS